MADFKHVALLSDGTKLTQEQYSDFMAHKPVTLDDGTVIMNIQLSADEAHKANVVIRVGDH